MERDSLSLSLYPFPISKIDTFCREMINTALLSQTQEGGVSLGNTNLYYRKYGGDEVQDVCEGREIRKGHNIGAQIIDDNIWIITANPEIPNNA